VLNRPDFAFAYIAAAAATAAAATARNPLQSASAGPVPAGFQRMSLADKLKVLDEANSYLQVCLFENFCIFNFL
jgi:hypothetical protein